MCGSEREIRCAAEKTAEVHFYQAVKDNNASESVRDEPLFKSLACCIYLILIVYDANEEELTQAT